MHEKFASPNPTSLHGCVYFHSLEGRGFSTRHTTFLPPHVAGAGFIQLTRLECTAWLRATITSCNFGVNHLKKMQSNNLRGRIQLTTPTLFEPGCAYSCLQNRSFPPSSLSYHALPHAFATLHMSRLTAGFAFLSQAFQ